MITVNKSNFLFVDQKFCETKSLSNPHDLEKVIKAMVDGEGATFTIEPGVDYRKLVGFFKAMANSLQVMSSPTGQLLQKIANLADKMGFEMKLKCEDPNCEACNDGTD